MMLRLLNTLSGKVFAAAAWDSLRARPNYIYPKPGDARDDFSRTTQSMRAVCDDFRRVAARELSNKQTYQR